VTFKRSIGKSEGQGQRIFLLNKRSPDEAHPALGRRGVVVVLDDLVELSLFDPRLFTLVLFNAFAL
jgi:hypothetical protein